MAEFEAIDESTFEKTMTKSNNAKTAPHALSAQFDRRSHKVWVQLDSVDEFSFDTRRAYGLEDASADDLAGVTVEGAGSTLRFPKLDADFSVSRLLEGFLGPLKWTKRASLAAHL